MDDKRKMQFIEVVMQWVGEISTTQLQEYFSISRNTAQTLIQKYQTKYPQNTFNYCNSTKRHTPPETFKPCLTEGSLNEYLSFFGEQINTGENNTIVKQSSVNNLNENNTHLELLAPPIRNINPTLVRGVIKACMQNLRMDIEYLSMTSGELEGRIICPHTLVNDGIRWHVRAYCEKNRAFRDFVLSRFGPEVDYRGKSELTKTEDTEWNHWLTVTLIPDPRLSAIKQKVIAMDYLMTDKKLNIQCRAALVKYLLQKLRVDTYQQKPEGQQIFLETESWEAIEPYRMN